MHLVAFDLLADADGDLLEQPLEQRRRHLENVLAGGPPQLPLCPQTFDVSEARTWLRDWAAAGIEGLVVKDATSRYIHGRAGRPKCKSRVTTDAIIGGITGSLATPHALLLGRLDPERPTAIRCARPPPDRRPTRRGDRSAAPGQRRTPVADTAASRLVRPARRPHPDAISAGTACGGRRGTGRRRVRTRPVAPPCAVCPRARRPAALIPAVVILGRLRRLNAPAEPSCTAGRTCRPLPPTASLGAVRR
ncbi:ATP-dependent DNA ligase [Actinoplanes sp. URMC 104]|uniref:ATP-dependent DNA ligase n=1 Tax=Actinoplanes sp. URMC 104 TaxID=3423409 RepID=UPI003F1C43CA